MYLARFLASFALVPSGLALLMCGANYLGSGDYALATAVSGAVFVASVLLARD